MCECVCVFVTSRVSRGDLSYGSLSFPLGEEAAPTSCLLRVLHTRSEASSMLMLQSVWGIVPHVRMLHYMCVCVCKRPPALVDGCRFFSVSVVAILICSNVNYGVLVLWFAQDVDTCLCIIKCIFGVDIVGIG